MISISNQETWRKADHAPQCGRASSHQLKAVREKKTSLPGTRVCRTSPPFRPSCNINCSLDLRPAICLELGLARTTVINTHTHTLHNIYIHKIYRYYFARLENGVHRIREPVSLQPARWRDGGTGHPRRIQHKHRSPERRGSTMLPLLCCDPGFGKPHGDQAANLSLHHHHL